METKKKKLHYGYVIVIGAFIQYFVCSGILYGSMGVFNMPVSTSLGIGVGTFTLWQTIQSVFTAICAILMPKLVGKFKYKKLTLIGIVVAGASLACMAFANSVWPFYIAGALSGAALTIIVVMYNGTIIPRWFKVNIGSMIATVLIGTRVGGIVFSPLASKIINTSGLFGFDEGWRAAYLILGAIILIVGCVNCLIIMRENPASVGLLRIGETPGKEETVHVEVVKGVHRKDAVKSVSFVFFVLMIITLTLANPIFSYFPAYAEVSGASAAASFDLNGIVTSVLMVGAIVGGYIVGGCNDHFGGHIGGIVGGAAGAIGLLIVLFGGANPITVLIGAALFGMSYVFTGLQYPAMTMTLYGSLDYEKIYPVATAIAPWFGAFSYSLWGFLYDATGSYVPMLVIGAILCVLTAVFGVAAKIASKSLADKWDTATVETKVG